jgi:hypothetical protein
MYRLEIKSCSGKILNIGTVQSFITSNAHVTDFNLSAQYIETFTCFIKACTSQTRCSWVVWDPENVFCAVLDVLSTVQRTQIKGRFKLCNDVNVDLIYKIDRYYRKDPIKIAKAQRGPQKAREQLSSQNFMMTHTSHSCPIKEVS